MSRALTAVLGVVVGVALALPALADTKPLPAAGAAAVITAKVTVVGVDIPGRVLTVKAADGTQATYVVSKEVKNFDQIKVGDVIVAKYFEAVAVRITKPGAPEAAAGEAVATATPGELPAGAEVKQVTLKAKITAIANDKKHITVEGVEGNKWTVKVKDPSVLTNVKVGDDVSVTYTQGFAIAVEPPAKK
jgi:Cu/Ag efflux protein CusF